MRPKENKGLVGLKMWRPRPILIIKPLLKLKIFGREREEYKKHLLQVMVANCLFYEEKLTLSYDHVGNFQI